MARKNWALNPSFELDSNADGLADGVALSSPEGSFKGTPVTTRPAGYLGSYAQRIAYTTVASELHSAGVTPLETTAAASFAAGDDCKATVYLEGSTNANGGTGYITVILRARDSSGNNLGYVSTTPANPTASFTIAQLDYYPLPASTDHVAVEVYYHNITNVVGAVFDWTYDCVLIEKAAAAYLPYFDGVFGGAWDGTANASTSQQVAATITGLSPTSGGTGVPLTVTTTGTGLQTGGCTVTVGGASAPITSWAVASNGVGTIVVTVPTLAAGAQNVVVTPAGDGGGTVTTGTHNYTVSSTAYTLYQKSGGVLLVEYPLVLNQGSYDYPLYQKVGGVLVPVTMAAWPSPPSSAATAPTWAQQLAANGLSAGATHTPAAATAAAVVAAMSAAAPGDTVDLTGYAVYPYDASNKTLYVKDGVRLKGVAIGIPVLPLTGNTVHSGTWLQMALRWGSWCRVENVLAGFNVAGASCNHLPCARGASNCGTETQTNGSHDNVFTLVRLKGGSDSGANLIDLGGNYGSGLWSGQVRTDDMIDTNWYDCEFERPQLTNAAYNTTSAFGRALNIWFDSRAGGGQFHDNAWNRCHFGVANGYHTGIDGYGIGQTILFQPAPAEHASDGPRPTGGSNNTNFDWSQVDHGFYDNRFVDCLFEYSFWCPLDVCDYARSFSMTHYFDGSGNVVGSPGAVGSNPPTTAQAANIPAPCWNQNFSITRGYFKGNYPTTTYNLDFEFGENCILTNCYLPSGTPTDFVSGRYGDILTGTFPGGYPTSPIFNTNWTGSGVSYTPSPYDPY